MADQKITELNENTTPVDGDLVPIVDIGGTVTEKLTLANLLKVVPTGATKNYFLRYNGTRAVWDTSAATYTFSLSVFDDGLTTGILAGAGDWKAAEAINFTASYVNGPPATAMIQKSVNGAAFADLNSMDGPAYTTGNNTAAVAYPTVDQYLRFQLVASDGVDGNTVQAASLYFYNYIYYGIDNINIGFVEADVEALTGTISTGYTTSRAINCTAGNYIVLAYPNRYTAIHASGFRFNTITCPFEAVETVSLTNTAGLTENYKVYASTNHSLGNYTLALSTSATLCNTMYYGVTTETSGWDNTDIQALANKYASYPDDNTQTWSSVTAAAGEYLLFAFPVRDGIPTFYVGGFEGGFESPATVSVTNANGYVENYYVWRSTNSGLGATVVQTV